MSTHTVLVPHTHWDREWYEPFQVFRLRLVDVLDDVIERAERDPDFRFTVDGQLAAVDDYLEIRPENRDRVAALVARGQLALAYPVMLGAALLVGTAGPATAVLLGDGWAGVEPLVRLFATAALMQTLAYVGYWVYLACGLSKLLLRFTLVTISVKVALVLIGAQWGVVGVVVGYTVAHTIEWPLSIAWLARHAPIPARRLTLGALRILAVGAVVAGVAHLASGAIDAGVWPTLLVGLGAGVVAFGLLVALVRPVRRDADDIRQVGAAFLRRKRES